MYWQCYLRMGLVYVPTTGVTKHDLYRIIEPVTVIPASNTEGLHRAFVEVLARGNPDVPALKPSDYPPPVLPKYAGVKSWNSFARNASLWAIDEQSERYKILGYRKEPPNGWIHDKSRDEAFPSGTSAETVIDRMIAILQAAATQRAG